MQIIRDCSYSRYPCNNMIIDYIDSLPDECLALIFSLLTTKNDRNSSSLVSHRWLRVEAQTRAHLTLCAHTRLKPFIPSIFTRSNSLSQLILHNTYYTSINDNDIILITSMCPNLTTLKLRECKQLTDSGMADFSKNCKKLKNFLCAGCGFSYIGMATLLYSSSNLEVLSIDRLCYSPDVEALPNFYAADSLKFIKLSYFNFDVRLLEPLIVGSKNLKRLELSNCGGNWDKSLEMIPNKSFLVEVHLDNVDVTNVGVSSLSKCRDLMALHIDRSRCTNVGLISFAENCKRLKKLYVGSWNKRNSQIGDEGLIAVGKHCVNLEELILSRVGATFVSLKVIATNCRKLISLELYWCETITEAEMISIVEKCVALRRLCIDEEVYALAQLDSMRARERLDNSRMGKNLSISHHYSHIDF